MTSKKTCRSEKNRQRKICLDIVVKVWWNPIQATFCFSFYLEGPINLIELNSRNRLFFFEPVSTHNITLFDYTQLIDPFLQIKSHIGCTDRVKLQVLTGITTSKFTTIHSSLNHLLQQTMRASHNHCHMGQ